jgi:DNA-binding IclR family transcriptional regulator
MLELLNGNAARCVKEIADFLEITEDVASKNLQLLAVAGFITRQQAGKYLYCSLVEYDVLLSEVLALVCKAEKEQVMFTATALTHERRIAILNALSFGPLEFGVLCSKTGVSRIAMRRQLEKLSRRGFIRIKSGKYILTNPECPLRKKMIELALEDVTLAQV